VSDTLTENMLDRVSPADDRITMRPLYQWAIVDPWGSCLVQQDTRRACIAWAEDFWPDPWPHNRRKGYRCVRVVTMEAQP
jgi:hypothetical protein